MHSTSEHVVIFDKMTSTTEEELLQRCKDIATAIASYTGWDRTDNILYPDSEHKFSIKFLPYTTYGAIYIESYFNNELSLNGSNNTSNSYCDQRTDNVSLRTLRIHRSSNEKTTYFRFGDGKAVNTFVYAINEKNEGVLFRYVSTTANNSVYNVIVGANALTAAMIVSIGATSGRRKYSVAKYVDDFSNNGGEFSELYWVYSTVSPNVDNTLVSFNGTVMRLITMNANAANMVFAMPVSDYVSGESGPESEGE